MLLVAAAELLRAKPIECEGVSLTAMQLPIITSDADAATQPNVVLLSEKIRTCTGVVIASPEYNHSIPPLLKNAIDWTTRVRPLPWAGKRCLLLSASIGGFGGSRMQPHLRDVLTSIGAHVMPTMITVPSATTAFQDGKLMDARAQAGVQAGIDLLVAECTR